MRDDYKTREVTKQTQGPPSLSKLWAQNEHPASTVQNVFSSPVTGPALKTAGPHCVVYSPLCRPLACLQLPSHACVAHPEQLQQLRAHGLLRVPVLLVRLLHALGAATGLLRSLREAVACCCSACDCWAHEAAAAGSGAWCTWLVAQPVLPHAACTPQRGGWQTRVRRRARPLLARRSSQRSAHVPLSRAKHRSNSAEK